MERCSPLWNSRSCRKASATFRTCGPSRTRYACRSSRRKVSRDILCCVDPRNEYPRPTSRIYITWFPGSYARMDAGIRC